MGHIVEIVGIVITLIGALAGMIWFIAKLAFKQSVRSIVKEETESTFKRVYERIDEISSHCNKNFVQVHYCNMQHNNLMEYVKSMSEKIDMLLERGLK